MEKGQGNGTDTLPGDNNYLRRGDVKCLLENVVCLHEELPAQIDLIPAADVVPVRHGRWIELENGDCKCSLCGCYHHTWEAHGYYCQHCGALMDKDGDEK